MDLNRFRTLLSVSDGSAGLVGAFLVLGAFLSGSEASAADVYGTSPTNPVWTDSSRYVECGQDCLYQKANENVTLQALYLVKKMDNLGKVLDGGDRDPTDYGRVVSELKLYCPDVDKSSQKQEDANLCYRRYVQTQLPILRAMKATLVKNEDMTSRLKTDQATFGGAAGAKHFQDETPGTRMAQTPQFSREAELLTSQAAGERLQYLASENYQKWTEQVSRAAPNPEDFPKTEQVLKDPTDPSSIKINRIVRNKDGSAVLDQNAYNLAKREFDGHIIGDTKSGTPVDLDIRNVALKGGYNKKLVRDVDPTLLPLAAAKVAPGKTTTVSDVDNLSYQQARNLAVTSEAALFARGVLHTQTYPGTNRKTASTDPKKPGAPQAPPSTTANKSSRTNDDPTANATGYQAVINSQFPIKEAPAPLLPAAGSNSVYNVTLSPDQIDKSIQQFQTRVDGLSLN